MIIEQSIQQLHQLWLKYDSKQLSLEGYQQARTELLNQLPQTEYCPPIISHTIVDDIASINNDDLIADTADLSEINFPSNPNPVIIVDSTSQFIIDDDMSQYEQDEINEESDVTLPRQITSEEDTDPILASEYDDITLPRQSYIIPEDAHANADNDSDNDNTLTKTSYPSTTENSDTLEEKTFTETSIDTQALSSELPEDDHTLTKTSYTHSATDLEQTTDSHDISDDTTLTKTSYPYFPPGQNNNTQASDFHNRTPYPNFNQANDEDSFPSLTNLKQTINDMKDMDTIRPDFNIEANLFKQPAISCKTLALIIMITLSTLSLWCLL